ncbi:MerR family transcriptional regulator [Neosynechococcus sphagnicola]|nr:hypothetical protein [Neosynechococcus sphagnicola]
MNTLTIKELTDAVGSGITLRMVRHYHQLGLMPLFRAIARKLPALH